MKNVFFFLVIVLASLTGCNSNTVSREDLRALALQALQESVKQELGGADTSIWKTTDITLSEPEPAYDANGRARLPASVTVKGSTFGCSYEPLAGSTGNVVYQTIDNHVKVQIFKTFYKLEFKVITDKSRIVSTTKFPCGVDKTVRGVITKVDVRGCSLTLGTNHGLYFATIPTEQIASLLAEKYQPGLAVSIYLDDAARGERAVFIEPQ